jgi:hypothetical protein
MYQFATIALLGLAVAAVAELVRSLGIRARSGETARAARMFVGLVLGVLLTWALDYSMFAGWGIRFRELWMGPVTTGLVIGGVATFWNELIGLLSSFARGRHGEGVVIEARKPRAA